MGISSLSRGNNGRADLKVGYLDLAHAISLPAVALILRASLFTVSLTASSEFMTVTNNDNFK